MSLQKQLDQWQQDRSDSKLFRSLTDAHDLTLKQIKLLTAIANHARCIRLSEVFVSPRLFEKTPNKKFWERGEVLDLKRRLFGRQEDALPTAESKLRPPKKSVEKKTIAQPTISAPPVVSEVPSPEDKPLVLTASPAALSNDGKTPDSGHWRNWLGGRKGREKRRLRRQRAATKAANIAQEKSIQETEPPISKSSFSAPTGIQWQSIEDPQCQEAPPTARE